MDQPARWIRRIDRLRAVLLVALLIVPVLAFGGLVWWFPVVAAALLALLAAASVARGCLVREFTILHSPAPLLAAAAIGLAMLQILPLPGALASRFSVRSVGQWSTSLGSEPATVPLVMGNVILSADRSATLRWVWSAIACLATAVLVSHYVDRLPRLRLVWVGLIVAFGVCTWTGCLQLIGQSPGAYGFLPTDSGPSWAATRSDVARGPAVKVLRPLGDTAEPQGARGEKQPPPVLLDQVQPAFAVGSLVTGPMAFLALASLVLPLNFGLVLHRLSARGSREPLALRLRHEGGVTPLLLMIGTGLLGVGMCGYMGGLFLGSALFSGVAVALLVSTWRAGVTRLAAMLFVLCAAALVAGNQLGTAFGRPLGSPWTSLANGWSRTTQVWSEALQLGLRFPIFGIGLNSFGAVHGQVKHDDACTTTALSSALQWWAETGFAGLVLVGLAAAWALWRLPRVWRMVGQADRPLAAALLGAGTGFVVFSTVSWTVQLPAVAIAAAALAGILNRWLAGGSDLFVEAE